MQNIVEFPGLGISFTLNDGIMIGTFKIAYYGIIIAFGLMLAMIYVFSKFKKVGVDPDKAIDCLIGGFIGGIVGARAYFVIFSWDLYKDDLWSIFNTRGGGLAIYGGIIGGLLVGVLIARWRKVRIKPLLDVAGIGFLIGIGIGRWGNFFNVEAFGSNTTMPWGMTSPNIVNYLSTKVDYLASIGVTIDPYAPVHPCFLYESIWCIIGVILLNLYLKHRKFDGEVFLMFLGYYGIGRFFIEGLRTDSLMIGNIRVSQLLAFSLAVACTIIIIVVRMKIKGSHDEEYLKLFVKTEEGIAILNSVDKKKTAGKVKTDDVEVITEINDGEIEDITDKKNEDSEPISDDIKGDNDNDSKNN